MQPRQVVWNTKNINELIQKVNQGFSAVGRDNPFFEINKYGTSIKKPNLAFSMSEEELAEFVKCRMDICYFAEKYCKIKNEKSKVDDIKLRSYQKKVLNMLKDKRYNILLQSRQTGKCVSPNTQIRVLYNNKVKTITLNELWFKTLPKKSFFDYARYFLYKILAKLD